MGRGDGAHGGVGVSVVSHAGETGEGDAAVPAQEPQADLGEKSTETQRGGGGQGLIPGSFLRVCGLLDAYTCVRKCM